MYKAFSITFLIIGLISLTATLFTAAWWQGIVCGICLMAANILDDEARKNPTTVK